MPPYVAGDLICFCPIALDMWPRSISFVVVVVGGDDKLFSFCFGIHKVMKFY